MKTTINPVYLSYNLLVVLLAYFIHPQISIGQCRDTSLMVCNSEINLSLNAGDSIPLKASMFLVGTDLCPDDSFNIIVNINNKDIYNPIVTASFPRSTFVQVQRKSTKNSCWSSLLLRVCTSGAIPDLVCPPDSAFPCTTSRSPFQLGFPLDSGVYQFSVGVGNHYSATKCDTCGELDLVYNDKVTTFNCKDPYEATYERTWTISGCSGASKTCTQIIHFKHDNIPDDVGLHNYDDVDRPKLDCFGSWKKTKGGAPTPQFTGFPNTKRCSFIGTTFTDVVFIGDCNQPKKVLRKWILVNWCTNEVKEFTQLLYFKNCNNTDTILPVVICDANITISLGVNGTATIKATTLDDGSYDNCGIAIFSFDPDGKQITKTFTKDDIGSNYVKLYVTDFAGNQSYCIININVKANANAGNGIIAGRFLDYFLKPTKKTVPLVVEAVDKNFNNLHPFECSLPKATKASYSFCSEEDNIRTPIYFDAHTNKVDKNTLNGLSSLDFVIMVQYLLGLKEFNKIQHFVADINCSGGVNVTDLVWLKKRILGQKNSFPCGDYKILEADSVNVREFSTHTINSLPDYQLDMVPVRMGDVSGNWNLTQDGKIKNRSGNVVDMYLEEQTFTKGEKYDVWLKIEKPLNFAAAQLSIGYDPKAIHIFGVQSPFIKSSNLTYLVANEQLRLFISDEELKTLKVQDSWLKISFKATQSGKLTDFFYDNKEFASLYVDDDIQENSIHINFGPRVATSDLNFDIKPLVAPNPFRNKINIDLMGQATERGLIEMFDLSGRKVICQKIDKNQNNIELNLEQTSPNLQGMYYLKITVGSKLYIHKVVRSK